MTPRIFDVAAPCPNFLNAVALLDAMGQLRIETLDDGARGYAPGELGHYTFWGSTNAPKVVGYPSKFYTRNTPLISDEDAAKAIMDRVLGLTNEE